jgi:hypothetical protein
MKNSNLHQAKQKKNDEFYTRMTDIERELGHYKDHFRGKVVYCNCDDPEASHFWMYFSLLFEFLGLKKLVSTHYDPEKPTYKLELHAYGGEPVRTPLKQNGDFRSPECVELLQRADIVVTNPPFSLFREYIGQLCEHDKRFLVIGSCNAITYKEVFKLIKENRVWLGVSAPKVFLQPDGTEKKFGNICWFTNLEHHRRREELLLWRTYRGGEMLYPRYDNYDAIEVSRVADIPMDYEGVMGVPITFLEKYNPGQFEIVKFRKGDDEKDLSVAGKDMYFRILVRKKTS